MFGAELFEYSVTYYMKHSNNSGLMFRTIQYQQLWVDLVNTVSLSMTKTSDFDGREMSLKLEKCFQIERFAVLGYLSFLGELKTWIFLREFWNVF